MLSPRGAEEWSALLRDAVDLRGSSIWAAICEEFAAIKKRYQDELTDSNIEDRRFRHAQGGFNAAKDATLVLEAIIRQAKSHLSKEASVESRDV